MNLSDLPRAELTRLLGRGELLIDLHPFTARICSDIPDLARDIHASYGAFALKAPDQFADFSIEISFEGGLRRWVKPMARFYYDGLPSFTPLPVSHAFPMMEWGLNWCVASHAHAYLVIHAAVIERDGRAVVLPAPPGSGKSTLCAALVHRGWRLLSDELALYDMDTGLVHGMARPVSLKNESIDVIHTFVPHASMTPRVKDTAKGTVSLLQPPKESVARAHEPARPAWIVLPTFRAGAPAALQAHAKERTYIVLAEQSFNYDIHGVRGFESLGRLVDDCACFSFEYSRLDDAAAVFEQLVTTTQVPA